MYKKILALLIGAGLLMTGCGQNAATATGGSGAASASGVSSSSASSVSSNAGTAASESAQTDAAAESASTDAGSELPVPDDAETVDTDPTADDIGDYLTLAEYKGLHLTGMKAYEGCDVNIDYVGTIDGEAFDGGSDENYDLVLGSNTFIDGFEDQLIGCSAGDEVTVDVTFPEDYTSSDLAGKEALFDVKVNSVSLTPENALSLVADDSTVLKYPSSYIEKWKDIQKTMYTAYAEAQSMDVDELMEQVGMTEEDLETYAKLATRQDLTAQAILAGEGITEDSSEYETAEEEVLSGAGYDDKEKVLSAGITEEQYRYAVEQQAAADVIEKYQAEA